MGCDQLQQRANRRRRHPGVNLLGNPALGLAAFHFSREGIEERPQRIAADPMKTPVAPVGFQVAEQQHRMVRFPMADEAVHDLSRAREAGLPLPGAVDQVEQRGHLLRRSFRQLQSDLFDILEVVVEGCGRTAGCASDLDDREVQYTTLVEQSRRRREDPLARLERARPQRPAALSDRALATGPGC